MIDHNLQPPPVLRARETSDFRPAENADAKFYSGAFSFLSKRVRRIHENLALYSTKNKNPLKQLLSRILAPGAMRRDRKKLEADLNEVLEMLEDVRHRLAAGDLSPAPAHSRSSVFEVGDTAFTTNNPGGAPILSATRRLIFLGVPPRIGPRRGMSAEKFLARCGRNTGNMMITHSLARELRYESAVFASLHGGALPARIDGDMIVFPASNFLNPSYDFSDAVGFLERNPLPCLMLGLGAQSKGGNLTARALPPDTRKFIEMVAERSETIGVRGAYTAELLAGMGVDNVEVIGCPSFYANGRDQFPVRKKPGKPPVKIALHGSRQVVKLAFDPERMRVVEDALLRDSLKYETTFFTQNGFEEASLALNPASLADWQMEPLVEYYKSSAPAEVRKFFRESNRIYGDIDQWRSDLAAFDFVIGTRFHGNIVALQAGVPAFLLVHDMRTLELAELLRLPHRRIDDPIFDPIVQGHSHLTNVNIARLYEESDFEPVQKAYGDLYRKYKALLERSGVEHWLE